MILKASDVVVMTATRRYVMVALIVILSVLLLPGRAGAISWTVRSQLVCGGGYSEGDSWTSWSGGNVFNDAQTRAKLYHWNAGSWRFKTESYGEDNGSSGLAIASTDFRYIAGSWEIRGTHTADFFSGTKNTDDGVYC